jgi:tRNA (cmo5U34)-methyltransferase
MSIPAEARSMVFDLACDFAVAGSTLYELGHPIAGLFPALQRRLARSVQFVPMDEREALPAHAPAAPYEDGEVPVRDASVAVMAGTSQQIHPLRRPQLLADVYHGLRAGGCALVVEMVRSRSSLLNNLFATHTRGCKHSASDRVGEMVQMAGTLHEEIEILKQIGFSTVDIFYKQYGLCGLIAIK